MTDEVVKNISDRYIELYEQVIGSKFQPQDISEAEMEQKLIGALEHLPPVPQTIGTL